MSRFFHNFAPSFLTLVKSCYFADFEQISNNLSYNLNEIYLKYHNSLWKILNSPKPR